MSARLNPSPRASAATSATNTVQVWPRSGGPSLSAASRPNSAMSSTPWAIACSSRNEPVPALQTRFMSASTTRPFSTLMNLASWPPISTIERLRPPSGSRPAAAVACATISFCTVSRSPSSGKTARKTVAAASRPEPVRPTATTGAGAISVASATSACAASTGLPSVRRYTLASTAPVAASTSAALEPVDPRSRPSTAGALPSRGPAAPSPPSRRVTKPGPRLAGSSRPMRLRTGRTSASGSAGNAPAPTMTAGAPPLPAASAALRPRGGEAQRAERLEHAGVRRDLDGRVAERRDASGDGADEGPVPDEDHGAVDLALVVQAVHVAGDALEEAAEDPPVRLALVGEVRELALGEHGAAAGDGHAVRALFRERDGLLERAAEPGAEALDGLSGARGAALVALVADAAGGVAREHRVAAAADAHDIERPLRVQPGGRLFLGDLLGHAAQCRLAETLAVHARRRDTRQPSAVQVAVEVEEGAERVAEVALRPRLEHPQPPVVAELADRQRGGHLAEVGADEEGRAGRRARTFGRADAEGCGGDVHALAYIRDGTALTIGRPSTAGGGRDVRLRVPAAFAGRTHGRPTAARPLCFSRRAGPDRRAPQAPAGGRPRT